MQYRQLYDGEEPSNWELYRLIADVHKAVNGNGQKGLVKTVEEHTSQLKLIGGSIALLVPIIAMVILKVLDNAARLTH